MPSPLPSFARLRRIAPARFALAAGLGLLAVAPSTPRAEDPASAPASAPAATRDERPRRPNILFVRTDDQARWAVGFHGNREVVTPNMDRLHREGASLDNAFTTTPVCSPSRVASMTGLHSFQAGIPDWIQFDDRETGLRPEFVTWPEVLHDAGYRTGFFGKWHLGEAPEFHPTRHGFDVFAGMLQGGAANFGGEIEVDGVTAPRDGVWRDDFVTERALEFIEKSARAGADDGRPWLAFLEFRAPHAPYAPVPDEDAAPFAELDPTIPPEHEADPARVARLTREYYAAIHQADRNLGRALDLLDRLGVARDTLVVFTSDHGYMLGHHGLHHKGNAVWMNASERKVKDPEARRPNMFDDSIRVPLAMRWPARIPAGTRVDAMILQLDLHPTMLALAGLDDSLPAPGLPPSQRVAGLDFSSLVLGRADAANAGGIASRDAILGDYDMRQGRRESMRMIRTRDWKLVRHFHDPRLGPDDVAIEGDELYDLRSDPGETDNLLGDRARDDEAEDGEIERVVAELDRKLAELRRAAGDPTLRE